MPHFLNRVFTLLGFPLVVYVLWSGGGDALAKPLRYDFPNLAPFSDFIELPESGLTTPFCAEWNPDFPFRGGQCCAKVPRRGSNHGGFCSPRRTKGNFCDE